MGNKTAKNIPTGTQRDAFIENDDMPRGYLDFSDTQRTSQGFFQRKKACRGRNHQGIVRQSPHEVHERSYLGHIKVPRRAKQVPVQHDNGEQLVQDLLQQLNQKNSEIERLREELQRKNNSDDGEQLQKDLMEQVQLNETLQKDLKNTEQKRDELTRSNWLIQREMTRQQQTIENLQNRLKCENETNEVQVVGGTRQKDDLCTLQRKLRQEINKNASLENVITNLKETITDQEDLCRDKDRRLNETRQALQEKCDQLEIVTEDKETLQHDVEVIEAELYKTQIQNQELDHTNKNLMNCVENLQNEVTEQQQTITNLVKQELKFKTLIQAEMDRNDNLEERLKLLNRKKEREMDMALFKMQHQLNVEKGKHKAYAAKMENCLTDANKSTEKKQDSLQKERQEKTELMKQLRREKAEKEVAKRRLAEAETKIDKVRHSEALLREEAQSSRRLQAKVLGLEKALEEQKDSVRDLRAQLKTEKINFKKSSVRFQEGDGLRKTDQQKKPVVEELSQALTTTEDTKRELEQEKEALQPALRNSQTHTERTNNEPEPSEEKKKRKSRRKFSHRS